MGYSTIQYKTCNAPYVTRMLFIGAGMDDTWLGSIGHVEKMSLEVADRQQVLRGWAQITTGIMSS